MNRDTATKAAAEAANHTATGFFQGIGFAAGAGVFGLIVGLIFHPFLLILGAGAGVIAVYKWRIRKRPKKQTTMHS